MKRIGFRITVLALVLLGLSAWYTAARAHEPASGKTVVIGADRIIREDFSAAGSTVEAAARVKGDLTAAGGNVTVSGPVEGDILAAGGTVNLAGPVGDDVRAAGGMVTIKAPIKDNALLAGGTVILEPSARVGRDVGMAGGDVQVRGPVGRDLSLAAGQATLSSEIGGNVRAVAEQLTLPPGAIVHGNLTVQSPNPPRISSEARVLGKVDYQKTESSHNQGSSFGRGFTDWLFRFLWLLVLGSAFLMLSRRWADQIVETMERRLGISLFAGFLGLVSVPVLVIVLTVTLVGLPLGLLLMAMYAAALMMSGVFVAYELGSWLSRKIGRPAMSPYARLAAGALVVPLLTMLPGVGWLIGLVIVMLGVGALVLERRELFLRLRADGLA